ncbi:MAG: acyl-CoA/acyl-ACP dehydrogenase [Acetobacteraceae bacterium]|nr:acyl-CoA/acyl-ACP dehydrogenase [Acetobacteraceae bacterium]
MQRRPIAAQGESAAARAARLTETVRASIPALQRRAEALDIEGIFPEQDMAALREAGLLAAPVPERLGGLGAGTEPSGAALLAGLLRLLGQGNLAVGRLFEAHVNAIRLVMRYGTAERAEQAAAGALAGDLFGLWVTDPSGERLRRADDRLAGRKGPCSGAGHCARALVTAQTPGGTQMILITLSGTEPVTGLPAALQGMRAASNGTLDLTGVAAPDDALIGVPGDYLREPDFSCGAWRTTAVTLGGLDALVEATRAQLVQRGYQDAPMQQARFGQILIAQETARLWTMRAADMAEQDGPAASSADRVAYVNLARLAVEAACLDALHLMQRSLGLAAFVRPSLPERLSRDLGTYLRQPAPDAVLLEAGAHGLAKA